MVIDDDSRALLGYTYIIRIDAANVVLRNSEGNSVTHHCVWSSLPGVLPWIRMYRYFP